MTHSTIRIALAEGKRRSRRVTVPLRPLEDEGDRLAVELLRLPMGTAALAEGTRGVPGGKLLRALARTALAVELGVAWGLRSGALTASASFVWPGEANRTVLRVLGAEGRVLAFAHLDEREEVPALEPRFQLPSLGVLQHAIGRAQHFPKVWAAAVQAAALHEAAELRRRR